MMLNCAEPTKTTFIMLDFAIRDMRPNVVASILEDLSADELWTVVSTPRNYPHFVTLLGLANTTETMTLLEFAVTSGYTNLAKQILEGLPDAQKRLALLSTKNLYGRTPLHIAASFWHTNMIEVMLNTFPKEAHRVSLLSIQDDHDQFTPLLHATYAGHLPVVIKLLSYISDPEDRRRVLDLRDLRKKTAVHIAAENGKEEIAYHLLNSYPQQRDRLYAITRCLGIAAKISQKKAARYLIDKISLFNHSLPKQEEQNVPQHHPGKSL